MKILQNIYVPKETVSDEFATVVKIYFKNGDSVKKGDILIDLETSKTVISISAETDGFLKILCKENEDVKIGSLLLQIVDTINENEDKSKNTDDQLQEKSETLFSNKALEAIEKYSLKKENFRELDFVDENDVLSLIGKNKKDKNMIKKQPEKIELENGDNIELIPIDRNKKREIEYLSDIQSAGMNSTLNIFIDVSKISEAVLNSFEIFKDSYLPIVIYETSRLLKKYKILNSYFANDSIAYYKDINIAMAVDMDKGLKVLTVPNTDQIDIHTLERVMYNLIEKYLNETLEPKDISNSTFTITDLSISGIDFFTPLINKKQAAILGISQVDPKLKRFCLSLVFDHRVTEGKKAGDFLKELKERIESFSFIKEGDKKDKKDEIKCYICLKTLLEDKKMEGKGFFKVIDHEGKENYICQSCLMGV